jgi:group I intron endonuclease
MRKSVFIYTLSDPDTGLVKYVGKTKYIDKRLHQHIRDCKKSKNHKNYWIQSLLKENLLPNFDLIDEVNEDEWQYWESFWISQLKSWGFKLTNSTDGGEGNNNQFFSEETRKKLSEKFSGDGNPFFNKKHSEETKEKMRFKKTLQTHFNTDKLLEYNIKRRKPVLQYDKQMNLICEWESVLKAAKTLDLIATHISDVCNNVQNRKTCGGYIWKHK